MLSFEEDCLEESRQYGPQHSTPIKSEARSHVTKGSTSLKSNRTRYHRKSEERKQYQDSYTSPTRPEQCESHLTYKCPSRIQQSNHVVENFFPEEGVDISQIPPPTEGSEKLGNVSSNHSQRLQCSEKSDNVLFAKHKQQTTGKDIHSSPGDKDVSLCSKCESNKQNPKFESVLRCNQYSEGCPGQTYSVNRCRCKAFPSSSSCLRSHSKVSSLSGRSDIHLSCSACMENLHNCLNYRPSEASLSAITSECCSPKRAASSSHTIQGVGRQTSNTRARHQISRTTVCSAQKSRSRSLPRTGCSGMNLCNHHTELGGPNISIADITKTSAAFLDNDIINKQREEIKLLMEELAGRDQELNELVKSHQRQVRAWESDRDKLNGLQSRLTKYEEELTGKEQQLSQTLAEMGRVQEQKEIDLVELGKTRADMVKLADRISENSNYIQEIEVQNKSLNASVKDLLAEKKRLGERENTLMKQLDDKTAECEDHKTAVKKMRKHLDHLENQMSELEEKCRRKGQENDVWKTKYLEEKEEYDKLAAEMESKDLAVTKVTQDLEQSLQQSAALQKALFTSCEREKCKEEVLHSLRKQHKRTMQELSNIRELYDIQAKERDTEKLARSNAHKDSSHSICSHKVQQGGNSISDVGSYERMETPECRQDHLDICQSRLTSSDTTDPLCHRDRQHNRQMGCDRTRQMCHERETRTNTSTVARQTAANVVISDVPDKHVSRGGFQNEERPHQSYRSASYVHSPGDELEPSNLKNAYHHAQTVCNSASNTQKGSISCQKQQQQQQQQKPTFPQNEAVGNAMHHGSQAYPTTHNNSQQSSDNSHYSTADSDPSQPSFNVGRDKSRHNASSVSIKSNEHQNDSKNVTEAKSFRTHSQKSLTSTRDCDIHHPDETKIHEISCEPRHSKTCNTLETKSNRKDVISPEPKGDRQNTKRRKCNQQKDERKMATRDKTPESAGGLRNSRCSDFTEPPPFDLRIKQYDETCQHNESSDNPKMAISRSSSPSRRSHTKSASPKRRIDKSIKPKEDPPREESNIYKDISTCIPPAAIHRGERNNTDLSKNDLRHDVQESSHDLHVIQSKSRNYEVDRKSTPVKPDSPKKSKNTSRENSELAKSSESLYNIEGHKRKPVLRQESYIITENKPKTKRSGTFTTETSYSNKTSNHTQNEEMAIDIAKERPYRDTNEILEVVKSKRDEASSAPALCTSASEVSNIASPCKFDDELTPADSDGMCTLLKRDMKKSRQSQSPNAGPVIKMSKASCRDVSANKQSADDECNEEHSSADASKASTTKERKQLRSSSYQDKSQAVNSTPSRDCSNFEHSTMKQRKSKESVEGKARETTENFEETRKDLKHSNGRKEMYTQKKNEHLKKTKIQPAFSPDYEDETPVTSKWRQQTSKSEDYKDDDISTDNSLSYQEKDFPRPENISASKIYSSDVVQRLRGDSESKKSLDKHDWVEESRSKSPSNDQLRWDNDILRYSSSKRKDDFYADVKSSFDEEIVARRNAFGDHPCVSPRSYEETRQRVRHSFDTCALKYSLDCGDTTKARPHVAKNVTSSTFYGSHRYADTDNLLESSNYGTSDLLQGESKYDPRLSSNKYFSSDPGSRSNRYNTLDASNTHDSCFTSSRHLSSTKHNSSLDSKTKIGLSMAGVGYTTLARTSGVGSYTATSSRHSTATAGVTGITSSKVSTGGAAVLGTSTTTNNYSSKSRGYMSSGVNSSYISRPLTSWYKGSHSRNFALNNNNDIETVDDNEEDYDEDAEISKSSQSEVSKSSNSGTTKSSHSGTSKSSHSATSKSSGTKCCSTSSLTSRSSDIHLLNTNNNGYDRDGNFVVNNSFDDDSHRNSEDKNNNVNNATEAGVIANNSDGLKNNYDNTGDSICSGNDNNVNLRNENSNNNNQNISVDNTADIYLEQILFDCVDESPNRNSQNSSVNLTANLNSDGGNEDVEQGVISNHQSSEPASIPENRYFTNRSRPSLYRQLAQVFFSETTRRYEWVVVPPHLTQAQKTLTDCTSCEVSTAEHEHTQNNLVDDTIHEQSKGSDVQNQIEISNTQLLSDDSCLALSPGEVCAIKWSQSVEPCHKVYEESVPTSMYSDSGVCSSGSYDAMQAGFSVATQKQNNDSKTLNAYNKTERNEATSLTSLDAGLSRCTHGVLSHVCHECILHQRQNKIADEKGLYTSLPATSTLSTTSVPCLAVSRGDTSTVNSWSHSVSHMSSCSNDHQHNASLTSSSSSPPPEALESFLGVNPSHTNHHQRDGQYKKQTSQKDLHRQSSQKPPMIDQLSPGLDNIVKKLDFDETTLETSRITECSNPHVLKSEDFSLVKQLNFDDSNLDSHGKECNSSILYESNSVEAVVRTTLSTSPMCHRDKSPADVNGVGRETSIQHKRLKACNRIYSSQDMNIGHDAYMYNDKCVNQDTQDGLTQYFHDMSTLEVQSDSDVSGVGEKRIEMENKNNADGKCMTQTEDMENVSKPGIQHQEFKNHHLTNNEHYLNGNSHQNEQNIENSSDNYQYHSVKCNDHQTINTDYFPNNNLPNSWISKYNMSDNNNTGNQILRKTIEESFLHDKLLPADSKLALVGNHQKQEQTQQQILMCENSARETDVHFGGKLSNILEECQMTSSIDEASPPPMSPSTKLQQLLVESQHLIWALERSSAVPEVIRSGVTHY